LTIDEKNAYSSILTTINRMMTINTQLANVQKRKKVTSKKSGFEMREVTIKFVFDPELPEDEDKNQAKETLLKALDRLLGVMGTYFDHLDKTLDPILTSLDFLFQTDKWARQMVVPGKFYADKFAVAINSISSELGKLGAEKKTKGNIRKMKILLNLNNAVTNTISAYYFLEPLQDVGDVESANDPESWQGGSCVVQNQYL